MNNNRKWWNWQVLLRLANIILLIFLAVGSISPRSERPPLKVSAPITTDLDRRLIYLLAESEYQGWTDDMRREYAVLRQQLGDDAPTIALLVQAENLTAQDIPVLQRLITAAIDQLDWDTATAHLETLLAIDPDNTWATYYLGQIVITRDLEQGTAYLTPVLLDPELAPVTRAVLQTTALVDVWTPTAYRELGLTLLEWKAWPFAEQAFSAALGLDDQDWRAYAYRGYVRDERGAESLVDFENAIALAPTSPLPFYFLGLHWRNIKGDMEAARDAFMSAYFLAPGDPALAAEVAMTFQAMEDDMQAGEWYDLAISLAPDDVRWHRLRAAFVADANFMLEDAGLAIIQTSYDLFPDDWHILTSMGYASYLIHRDSDARSYLEYALDLNPDDARTHYYYGLVMNRLGHLSSARAAFRTVIDLDGPEGSYGYLAARALQ